MVSQALLAGSTACIRGSSLARGTRRPRAQITRQAARVVAYKGEAVQEDKKGKHGFANQLEALRSMSTVVADTGDIDLVKKFMPVDCTTNPSLVLKAVQMPEYKHMLDEALAEEAASGDKADAERPFAGVVDRLAVNIGCELLKIVPGRVSTEVDAHLSYDTAATVAKARKLIALYEAKGVSKDRVYIKMASTWEGIEACRQLQAEGIDCNLTLLFSFAQAAACANANAALISPFVGRILDWYKQHEGGDYEGAADPGVQSVQRIYKYYKKYGYQTIVMAASFRNVGEITNLAGCDNITIAPALLAELEACTDALPRILSPDMGGCEDADHAGMTEAEFRTLHAADQMASDKLPEGIDSFAKDQRILEAMLAELTSA